MISPVSTGSILLPLSEVARLRQILRKGWRERGVDEADVENDWDHTLNVVSMVLFVPTRRQVSRPRAMYTAFIHDLPEIVLEDKVRREEAQRFL